MRRPSGFLDAGIVQTPSPRLVVIGHIVIADQIRDTCGGNRRLEFVGLSDEPIGELAAVAHSLDPHTFSINPQVAPHRRAGAIRIIQRVWCN